jgi:small ligand-binding sensory domain FIST
MLLHYSANDKEDTRLQCLSSGLVGLALSDSVDCHALSVRGCRPVGPVFLIKQTGGYNSIDKIVAVGDIRKEPKTPLEVIDSLIRADSSLNDACFFVGLAHKYASNTNHIDVSDNNNNNNNNNNNSGMRIATTSSVLSTLESLSSLRPKASNFRLHSFHLSHDGAFYIVGGDVKECEALQVYVLDPTISESDATRGFDLFSKEILKKSSPTTLLGGLLFTCVARGKKFYNKPNVDSGIFVKHFPCVDVSGFFCGGEIGPEAVGGGAAIQGSNEAAGSTVVSRCCVQGFTSVFALFCCKLRENNTLL